MQRGLRIVGVAVLVLVAIVAIALNFFAGSLITTGVRTVGPLVLKVPVTLDGASARLFRGKVGLKGLIIGNPEGFETPYAFKLGEFNLAMSVPSVFSDRIRIDEVTIDGPEISYELSLRGSNLGALMKALEPADASGGEKPAEAAGAQKKVEIGVVRVTNAKVKLGGTALQGKVLTIPLPTVEIRDIGKEKEGASIVQAVTEVLKAVVASTGQAVGSAVGSVGDAAEAAGTAAVKGAQATGEAVAKGAEGVAEGAVAAGEAVGKAAGKLVGGAASLFKKSEAKVEEGAERAVISDQ